MAEASVLCLEQELIEERKFREENEMALEEELEEQTVEKRSTIFRVQEELGELFTAVQLYPVFSDSKTFVDCSPLIAPELIVEAYNAVKNQPDFNLTAFVYRYFKVPHDITDESEKTSSNVIEHIEQLWPTLTRTPGDETLPNSLITLPNSYIVPGGRFREVYYWDTFFTMLGLQKSNLTGLIQDIVDNFTYLIDVVGHIPNGNREYYTTRSQPPFYALMLGMLAQIRGEEEVYTKYESALLKEYEFWMDGAKELTEEKTTHRRAVRMPDGAVLNRYYDDLDTPRPESYREDLHMAQSTSRNAADLFRNIRAAAESGWDFSSRWFTDPMDMTTIRTIELIPVDLNSLMYHMEITLAKMAKFRGDIETATLFTLKAEIRRVALITYCWSEKDQFFYDYDFVNGKTTDIATLAAGFPLFFNIATNEMAAGVARRLEDEFLDHGGLLTTLQVSPQQWDAPNGWAPLQWINIEGLRRYGYTSLANSIVSNWTTLNITVFNKLGKLMEKYNVESNLEGGGGEYPTQDGFGWTNGVLLVLLGEKDYQA